MRIVTNMGWKRRSSEFTHNDMNSIRRLCAIVYSFTIYAWTAFVRIKGNSVEKTKKRAILFRQTIEGLGSVFVKFGQFLSLRPDFIPIEYCRELFYLLESVPSFPFSEAEKIFLEEFDTRPDKLFASIKTTPFAAASFGQVYEAYLPSGEKVAVKVQRPGIRQLVNQDIKLMKIIAKIVDSLPLGPNKLLPMVEQFEYWTIEELDYVKEADYTEEFYLHYKGKSDKLVVPRLYKKYCSSRVLTAEFIEGITLSKILLARRADNKEILNKLKKQGFSKRKVAETLLKNSIKQIYFDGFFHADPHPANVIFTPDKKLAYIDFGIVGRLDKKSRFACLRYTRSTLYGDTKNAFEALLQLCNISDTSNIDSFREEHDLIVNETLNQFKNSQQNGNVRGLGQVVGKKLVKTMKLLQKYKVVVPSDTLRYFRALSTLDSTVVELCPEIELENIARSFRNISIANLIIELPSLVDSDKMEDNKMKWLNILEKEILTNQD